MPKVYVALTDVVDELPAVLGVSATLEGAQVMALEYCDQFLDAHINPEDAHNIIACDGQIEVNIFERFLEVPENGFSD